MMSDDLDNLPPKLKADLSRAVDRPVEIPADVDAAMLAIGRKYAANRRRFRFWRATIGSLAAAAMLLLGWMLWPVQPNAAPQMAMSRLAASPLDLDGSGRVDILDAYALAKQLPNGKDINGDGKVDQADVDAIAKVAVDLKGGARP
jgi:hypothetical protein